MTGDVTPKKRGNPKGNPQNLAPAWQKGQSGNPAGRPKGARSQLTEDFLKALALDFETSGIDAIIKMREEKAADYIKVIAGVIPKEITGEDGGAIALTTVIERRVVKANN
jgi:Family of unknown function (DUF5681)